MRIRVIAGAAILSLALAACSQAPDDAPATPPATAVATAPEPPSEPMHATPSAEALIEHGSAERYRFTIHYPEAMREHAALADALKAYAHAARDEHVQSATEFGADADADSPPWTLDIRFETLHQDAQLVVIGAEGEAYSGGSRSAPILGRFVYHPASGRVLAIEDWFEGEAVWQAFGEDLRAILMAGADYRYGEIYDDPEQLRQALERKSEWIENGAASTPDNYRIHEPVFADNGRIRAFRVWFPPYQIGSFAEGTEYCEVPIDAYTEWLKPAYRELFDLGD